MPSDLVLSLREDVLQRAIDRIAADPGADGHGAAPAASPAALARAAGGAADATAPRPACGSCATAACRTARPPSRPPAGRTCPSSTSGTAASRARTRSRSMSACGASAWSAPGAAAMSGTRIGRPWSPRPTGTPCAPKPGPALASLLGPLGDLDTGLTLTRLTATRAADAQLAPAEQRALAAAQDMQHERAAGLRLRAPGAPDARGRARRPLIRHRGAASGAARPGLLALRAGAAAPAY